MNNYKKRIKQDAKKLRRAFWISLTATILVWSIIVGGIGWIAYSVLSYLTKG